MNTWVKPPIARIVDKSNPITRGLVGAWFLTEKSGLKAYDSSGYENHADLQGWTAPPAWTNGPTGSILYWNEGTGVSADTRLNAGSAASLDNLTDFTWGCRVYLLSQGRSSQSRFLAKGTGKIWLVTTSPSASFTATVTRASVNSTISTNSNTIVLNAWATLFMTYSEADGIRIYLAQDGGRVAEVSFTGSGSRTVGSGATSSDASDDLILGNRNAYDRPLDGYGDWWMVWNRTLSLAEMQEIKDAPYSLISPPDYIEQWLVSSSGVSGTSTNTNANDTSSASGTTTVTGTSTTTNSADTSSASGTTTVTGSSSTTNSADTSSASGTSTVTGTSATTNTADTSSASGTTTVTGTSTTTNANDTGSAAGTTTVTGTSTTTNANDTPSASGAVGDVISGSSATTNANDTSSASGTTTVTGSSANTNAADTSSASGTTTVTGSSSTTNQADTGSASGTLTIVGSVAATNANDTSSAQGFLTVYGTVSYTNEADTSSASGVVGDESVAPFVKVSFRTQYKTIRYSGQSGLVWKVKNTSR